MTNYEMTEKLSEKMGVSMEKAKAALEASDWDMLDAAILLEQEAGEKKKDAYTTRNEAKTEHKEEKTAADTLRRIGRFFGNIIRIGNRNKFEIWRKGEMIVELPVTAAVLLLLLGHGFAVALLIIGLFTGFKYRFSGEELGKDSVNSVMDKVSKAADRTDDDETKSE